MTPPFNVLILTGDDPERYRTLQDEGIEIHVRAPSETIPEIERVDAVIGGWFSRELLESAGRLKYFLVPFAGLPPDLGNLLRNRPGLHVANCHYSAPFVAEHVFAMIFHLWRNLQSMDRFMRRSRIVRRRRPAVDFVTLQGKTMGILGRGHIGREVQRRALAFGMDTLIYSRGDYLQDPDRRRLHDLLGCSRIVVLALPLTQETREMIAQEEFAHMGGESIFINVSRGEIVKEQALFDALHGDRIQGAGVDAWYNYVEGFFSAERPYTCPFHRLANIVMTPHVAYQADVLEAEKLRSIRTFIREAAGGKSLSGRIDPSRGY